MNISEEVNKDKLIIYYYSKHNSVGKEIHESIKKTSTYINLDLETNWRQLLSNEYMIPFIVDSLQFNSIEHFLQYSKFNNRDDIDDKVVKRNHQRFANMFCASTGGIYSNISAEKTYEMGSKQHTEKYNITISEDWLAQRVDILKKGLYAKCSQQVNLKNMLVLTSPALLISPFKGAQRKHKYRYNNELMYVRQLFISNQFPTGIYPNYEKDFTIFSNTSFSSNYGQQYTSSSQKSMINIKTTTETDVQDEQYLTGETLFEQMATSNVSSEAVDTKTDQMIDQEDDYTGAYATKEVESNEEQVEDTDEDDETYEQFEESREKGLDQSLRLDKFLDPTLEVTFNRALEELSTGNQKKTDWIWYFFPQAPFGESSTSLKYSLIHKKDVVQYIYNDILRNRYIILLDILIQHKIDIPDITILDIMGSNMRPRLASLDKMKLMSSITLFYHVAKSKYDEWMAAWGTTEEKPEYVIKGLANTKEIIDKITLFKATFDDFIESKLVLELLQDIPEEEYFKPVIDEIKKSDAMSASGGFDLSGGDRSNVTATSYTDTSKIDMNTLSNIDHLHNLVGGNIDTDVLKIALKNNNNNVYRSLTSLANEQTLNVYKILAKQ